MLDPFGRVTRPPGDFSREGRVRLLAEAFEALMRGDLPSPEARMFLASAGMAWLQRGGSLERDYLKVVKRAIHHTPAAIWRRLQSEGDDDEGASSR